MTSSGLDQTSSVEEEDELNVLGGKTRLVAKKEPASPTIMERSPISQNPVVPLPLSPSTQNQVHPTIWEYLNTFGPQADPNTDGVRHQGISPTHSQHNGYNTSPASATGPSSARGSYDDMSPVSMYGMSTMSASSSFHAEPNSYVSHSQIQHAQSSPTRNQFSPNTHYHVQHQQHHSAGIMGDVQMAGSGTTQSFPQYFPVYDYGSSVLNGATSHSTGRTDMNGPHLGSGLMLDAHPMPASHRRTSGSPEGNMQATWNEFVAGVAM